jgi:hypothetical protein
VRPSLPFLCAACLLLCHGVAAQPRRVEVWGRAEDRFPFYVLGSTFSVLRSHFVLLLEAPVIRLPGAEHRD